MKRIENPHRSKGLDAALPPDCPAPSTDAARVRHLLKRCPHAGVTPLVDAAPLARALGLGRLWVKDERARMGLGSFKALGAAYVIACDAEDGRAKEQSYVTASAGNHGLSVAAGAAAFGAKAVIYLSETVPESFAERLRAIGAEVRRAGAEYEASMEAAAQAAAREGMQLLSDSSWPGYYTRPHRLMEGYLALMDEVFDQIDTMPSHILLQAGVGGLAGAAAAAARAEWGDAPQIIVVEPEAAPALMASITAGRPVAAPGPVSIMGRLDCKEPSLIALKGLARDADAFVTLTEAEAQSGCDLAAAHGLGSTPSGAAGLAALSGLALGAEARVLCILSEMADA
ncbi:MAG: pyridoxal-phosphate dependent enzyme [Rhodobacteraceae bacterium]|nr:pyridoxal-phosphate dependent enzyme [Paracoccaceae bacterium]